MVLLEMEFCNVLIFITFSSNPIQSKCYPKAGAGKEEAGGGEEEAAWRQEEEGAGGQRKGRGLLSSSSQQFLTFDIHATWMFKNQK